MDAIVIRRLRPSIKVSNSPSEMSWYPVVCEISNNLHAVFGDTAKGEISLRSVLTNSASSSVAALRAKRSSSLTRVLEFAVLFVDLFK